MNRDPIIRESSFWADLINLLAFRRVWREKKHA
jgi:hypothetical protein